jgi:hypothetical protein
MRRRLPFDQDCRIALTVTSAAARRIRPRCGRDDTCRAAACDVGVIEDLLVGEFDRVSGFEWAGLAAC